jgi:antitoxin ChpS
MFDIKEMKPMARTKGETPDNSTTGSVVIAAGFATKGQSPSGGFSTTSKLKKAGGSLVLIVPAAARNMLGLTEGQEMIVSVNGRQVIAEPASTSQKTMKVRRPKYTLDELLEGYDANAPLSAEEHAWINAPAVGSEVW